MKLFEKLKQAIEEVTRQSMSVTDAFKVLGLNVGEYDKVDKAFKTLAMKYHPDRGGDPEKMKELNNAKEVLNSSPQKAYSSDTYKAWRDEREKKVKSDTEENEGVIKRFYGAIKGSIDSYGEYLSQFVPEGVKLEKTEKLLADQYAGRLTVLFKTPDNDIYFEFTCSSHFYTRMSGGLSGGDFDVSIDYTTFVFYKGKKYKMQASTWKNRSGNYQEFKNPEKLFPKSKLLKVMKDSENPNKKVTKKDFEALVKVKFKGRLVQGYYYIPIEGDKTLVVYRSVIRRVAAYGINGLYDKSGGRFQKITKEYITGVLPENNRSIEKLIAIVDLLNKGGEWSEVQKIVDAE